MDLKRFRCRNDFVNFNSVSRIDFVSRIDDWPEMRHCNDVDLRTRQGRPHADFDRQLRLDGLAHDGFRLCYRDLLRSSAERPPPRAARCLSPSPD